MSLWLKLQVVVGDVGAGNLVLWKNKCSLPLSHLSNPYSYLLRQYLTLSQIQAGFKPVLIPPKCWHFRCEPPHLATFWFRFSL